MRAETAMSENKSRQTVMIDDELMKAVRRYIADVRDRNPRSKLSQQEVIVAALTAYMCSKHYYDRKDGVATRPDEVRKAAQNGQEVASCDLPGEHGTASDSTES
jgi:hypothetical protein